MSSPEPSLAPLHPSPPVPRVRRLGGTYRLGRPSRKVTAGRREWVRRLTAAGRLEEAAAYAARYRLAPAAAAETLQQAATGGEGVKQPGPAGNWDKTAPIPQISQCESALTPAAAVMAVVAAALSEPALAAGGGEGGTGGGVGAGAGGLAIGAEEAMTQAESSPPSVPEPLMQNIVIDKKWGNFPNFGGEWGIFPTLQDGQELGRVGRRCRNKWYVEVEVAGVWGKAEIGDWVVHPHDWVVVELAWASADGRDKEWRIVAKMQPAAPKPDPVPVVAQLDAPVIASLEDFDSGAEPPTAKELEHPGAEDFMERARREAYAAYSR